MTVAAPLAFPGSRTLSDWWRQLAPWRPRAWWVGHLLLHRVEAPVQADRPFRLDRFALLLLKAVALEEGPRFVPEASTQDRLDQLDQQLHLGRPWIQAMLGKFQNDGLVARDASNRASLTELGRQALERSEYPNPKPERRVFYFRDRDESGKPPHFLNLNHVHPVPWQANEGWVFNPELLSACVGESSEWKQRHGFPQDVQRVLGLKTESPPPGWIDAWQKVILDRAEHLLVVLLLAPQGDRSERLLGFAASEEGWALRAEKPVITLNSGWLDPFPELEQEPEPAMWQESWLAWCRPRGLPTTETLASGLERRGHRLIVHPTPRLHELIEAAHRETLRSKAWLVAGKGLLRPAALVEIAAPGRGEPPATGPH